jgi:putative toxin-antitoxin system antitoxin component (TIGR02293 family)
MVTPAKTRRTTGALSSAPLPAQALVPSSAPNKTISLDLNDSARIFTAAPSERIRVFKAGVPARHIDTLSSKLKITKEALIDTLRLSRATVSRKARHEESLTQDESERVLGLESLIGQVQVMVEQSGDGTPFDCAAWLSHWLYEPLPALGGELPANYMDSIEGQKLVANLLAMTQSGAYA